MFKVTTKVVCDQCETEEWLNDEFVDHPDPIGDHAVTIDTRIPSDWKVLQIDRSVALCPKCLAALVTGLTSDDPYITISTV